MIIHYLPILTLDLATGVRTNVLTGETAQVDIKTELERAKQWYEKQFYFKPHNLPQYQAIIKYLS